MANTEDILYEARELGIYDRVMKESRKLAKKHPHMEVADRMDKAIIKIKNETTYDIKGPNGSYGV